MIRRPRRVIPASIVALLLLAAMVILIWSCVQVVLGQQPILPFTTLAEQGSGLRWNDVPVLISGGVLAALGLILLVCAWLPGAPNVLALADIGGRTQAGVTRRSARQALATAAGQVDGVSSAAARLNKTRVRATVHTPLHKGDALREEVGAAVEARWTTIGLQRSPRVSVRVNRMRSS